MPYPWVRINDKNEINPLCDDVPMLRLQTEVDFVSNYSENCYNANDAHRVRRKFSAVF